MNMEWDYFFAGVGIGIWITWSVIAWRARVWKRVQRDLEEKPWRNSDDIATTMKKAGVDTEEKP